MGDNSTGDTSDAQLVLDLQSIEQWLVPLIFGVISVIGLIGNSLVIYVIVKHGQMKTVTNYYIVNLAITDISFLLCCAPFTAAIYATRLWVFGRFMCKFVFMMMQVTSQATCLTLTAMTVDRYQAIVRPLQALRRRTTNIAIVYSICIWTGSMITSVHAAIFFDVGTPRGRLVCYENYPPHLEHILYPGYALYSAMISYAIPLIVITICYAVMLKKLWTRVAPGDLIQTNQNNIRQKRKVTRMVLVVVIIFAVCCLPTHVFNIWYRLKGDDFPYSNFTYNFKILAHTLTYANSSCNPFVYAFMGENFRRYFIKAFPKCFRKKRTDSSTGDELTNGNGGAHRSNFTLNDNL